ncbi:MAG TPA: PfkB family carbohydrate kinase [Abditibacteriaceae bacterium]|jgi:sugar/nucleoside kinase (ribokinase family)
MILGFGALAVDDLLYVDEFPLRDGKTRVRHRHREGGGLAGTALVAASRLGVKTAWCGVLGNDELSRYSHEQLEIEGVDCSRILKEPDARPHYSVIVVCSDGSRSILACNDGVTPFPAAQMDESLLRPARVVFIDHTTGETGVAAASLAQQLGIPVVADIERVDAPYVPEMLPLIDHLLINLQTAKVLACESTAEDCVKRLMTPGRIACVVTDGAHGCWLANADSPHEVQHVPAFAVDVVDTTGCGDVFHGAYMACLARGEDVQAAVRFASATAAIKATQRGGRSGIPDRATVEAFMSSVGA